MIKEEARLRGSLLEKVALYNALQGVVIDDDDAVDGDVKEELGAVVEQGEQQMMKEEEQACSSGEQQMMKGEEPGEQLQEELGRDDDQAEIVKGLASGDEEYIRQHNHWMSVSSDPYLQVLDDDE